MFGPTPSQRLAILSKYVSAYSLSGNIDVDEIGIHMHGYVAGDIATLARDTALRGFARYLIFVVATELISIRTAPGETMHIETEDFIQIIKSRPPHNLVGLSIQVEKEGKANKIK